MVASLNGRAGDWDDDFAEYVGLQQARLLAIAQRITGCKHAAEDVVQDALLAFHTHLVRRRLDDGLGPWLTKVVTNNALLHVRRQRRRKLVPLERQQEAEPTADAPGSGVAGSEALAKAWRRVSQLPEQERQAFVLRVVEGWDYGRIASCLGVSPATARGVLLQGVGEGAGGVDGAVIGSAWDRQHPAGPPDVDRLRGQQ